MGIQHLLKTAEYTDVVVVSDSMLHRIQHDLLEMMKDINEVLLSENIRWCLSGGSVLGAKRHNGFIPWDDDIDIFMLRADYDKLKSIFEEKLGHSYILKCPGDKNYTLNLPQIQKKGTTLIPIQSTQEEVDGLFIDIFILENTYDNKLRRFWHGLKSTILLFICSSMRMKCCGKNIIKFTNGNQMIRKEIDKRAFFSKFFSFFSMEKWLAISDACFSALKKKTKYVVCPSGAKHFFGEIYERDMFEEFTKGYFETEEWPLPNRTGDYLSKRYGVDYMMVPQKSEQEHHVYAKLDLGD